MSKLLINEPPLQVLPSLAVKFGLNEAMILQQMHYWLQDSRNGVEKNGKRWIFNSYKDWKKQFPFWSERTIQRAFLNLESASAIISRQEGTNRRKFYTVNYEILDDPSCQNGTMNVPDGHDDDAKVAHSSITEKTTEKTSNIVAPKKHGAQVYQIATILSEVCEMDFELNKGQLLREAKSLIASSALPLVTTESIRENYNGHGYWSEHDWRGQKGQRPTPSQIRQTWGKWLKITDKKSKYSEALTALDELDG